MSLCSFYLRASIDITQAQRNLLNVVIGAVWTHKGRRAVFDWVEQLVMAEKWEESDADSVPEGETTGTSKRRERSASPLPNSKRPKLEENNRITLAEFHSIAAKKECRINYSHEELSKTPNPSWESLCRGTCVTT